MTSRERFLQTLDFECPDQPWVRAYAFVCPQTRLQWRTRCYLPTNRKKERQPMGIVVDQSSGALGIVTMKDLVEEIVGDLAAW